MAMVTKETVFGAADALTAKGASVTQIAVRDELGGGSFSTISVFLKEWRDAQAPATVAVVESAPAALRERLEALLATAWSEAGAAANARLEAATAAAEASAKTLQRERDDALAFADRVSSTVDAAEARAAEAVDQARARDTELATVKEQLAAAVARATEQAETIKTLRADHHASQADVARLTGELRAAEAREAEAEKRAANTAHVKEVAQRAMLASQEGKAGKGKGGG